MIKQGLTILALVTVSLWIGGCDGERPDPPVIESSSASLTAVTTCEDLRGYAAEVVTDAMMGNHYFWGWGGEFAGADDVDADSGSEEAPTDFTETNTQEEGVDEADIIETDGSYIYVLHENELIILDSWPAEETNEVGRIDLGTEGWGAGMFLDGDRVVTLSSDWHRDEFRWGSTKISVVDVSDRADPSLVYQAEVEGWFTDARAIDGQVYLVSNTTLWDWWGSDMWEMCDRIDCRSWYRSESPLRDRAIIRARLLGMVEAYFADVPIEDLLPQRSIGEGDLEPALSCSDLHRPRRVVQGGLALFTWLDMHADRPEIESSGVIGGGYNLYASRENIYLAQTSYYWGFFRGDMDVVTGIHKLSLPDGGGAPRYEASGTIQGWTLDQFSMSEYEGNLRVASSDLTWWGDEGDGHGNQVWVLSQEGNRLRTIGSLRGLSPGQRIYAVRFMGDMGYMVTFQQIDPLHVIDLQDPTNPVELGELEIPGFSTYLHPFADGLLLAIGRDGDWAVQLSMFDVRDPSNPTRLHQETIDIGEWWGWSEALYDHHAFTYHSERQMLAIPINIYRDGEYFTGSIVYRVSEDNGFVEVGRVDHADIARAAGCPEWHTDDRGTCYDEYRWWVSMRRNVFIEDNIYSLSSVGMSVDDLYNPDNHHASVVF